MHRGNWQIRASHTLSAIPVRDPGAVFARLDQTKAKYDNMVLVHGGGPGVERVAAQWAERNGVDQVVCKQAGLERTGRQAGGRGGPWGRGS